MTAVASSITLSKEEEELFETLALAAQHAGKGTVLRAAGGWVRDKLLGKGSLDIDIALDNMFGKDFAAVLAEYMAANGKQLRNAVVIQSNPEQSKHLETARVKVGDLWLDLVNLRSETYANSSSRIPVMEFGTPEQDAVRRDFTINSLFYNINTKSVEDLTGRGLDDLRQGIIRTPLPPSETFLDDPLRVLRAVRFATRFNFELDGPILAAAAQDNIRSALASKVSKERIGTEVEGMFNGPGPVPAMKLLNALQIFPIVFALPATASHISSNYATPCVACMDFTAQLLSRASIETDAEQRRFLLLAAVLLPLRSMVYDIGKGRQGPVSSYAIREGLKWRAKDVDAVTALHQVAPQLEQLGLLFNSMNSLNNVPDSARIQLGTCIRTLKANWQLGVLLAATLACRAATPLGVEGAEASLDPSTYEADFSPEMLSKQAGFVTSIIAAAHTLKLDSCWQWKPLLDGKAVMQLFKLQKAGPETGKMLASVMDWQLCHPEGSVEQCREFLLQAYPATS